MTKQAQRPMRLDPPAGLLINRRNPVHFTFEGKHYQGLEGDSIASALLANGRWLLSRSFKYHRPRGPLSMAGQDANTLVQMAGEPNVLADREPLTAGLQVRGQNYNGSLDHDKDAVFDRFWRFMPVGFYYRAFFKPAGAWRRWENIIRKKAGLGQADLNFVPQYHDKAYLFYDVVVVGSGPAGLSAALQVADLGGNVLLVEQESLLGGALSYHRFDIEGSTAEQLRLELVRRVTEHEAIHVLLNATCNGWFKDNYLPVIQGNRLYKIRAKECIVASGAFEQHVVFHNNDLPGVVLCSAVSRMMKHYALKPGQCAVVLTGNDEGYMTALDLDDNGIAVAVVIDMRPEPESAALIELLALRNIPVKSGYAVFKALPGRGKKHVRAIDVRKIIGRGKVADNAEIIDCDLLAMTAGYMPCYQLLCQAGAQLTYDDLAAEFSLTELPEHVHSAGSVNGIHSLESVLADGKRAAICALGNLQLTTEMPEEVHCTRRPNYEWPIFEHPDGKDFVDFDEDLQVQDIVNAIRLGYRDIQLVKRFSTVGMGPSQGRHSALPTARLVASVTNRTVSETGVTTARPPFIPEKLAYLVGRNFDPYRRTPMHYRHLQLGARMIPAGNWQRPGFYGLPADRDRCIQDESRQVRTKVGLIDVGTLGGIDVRGPDAAELLNRMYTMAFEKQPVGKTRYAVMTNEQGVVIDDGVCCRISAEHFYVTATTSGVVRVYRDMMKWNAQWCLDVDISNVTSAFSGVNLAGPDARRVLKKIIEDVALSAASFPYLAYREGRVVGIPARLLRVGFVGELGYEIHVPTLYGEVLWDVIMEAGREFAIKPFGVETQRLLRLEKGHFIIGQDTDSMSHPGELGLEWAINRKKPFFVGRRSLDIVMAREQTRKLVGFSLPNDSSKPEEGHLVLEGNNISGHVTSCEYSSTIGSIIGMAFVSIRQCTPNTRVPIRVKNGEVVSATVVKLPFFDPENKRQEL